MVKVGLLSVRKSVPGDQSGPVGHARGHYPDVVCLSSVVADVEFGDQPVDRNAVGVAPSDGALEGALMLMWAYSIQTAIRSASDLSASLRLW